MNVTKRYEFDAAHRLLGYDGKCGCLHGHRYGVEITVESDELDENGMVIDFSAMDLMFGDLINDCFDHSVILYDKDEALKEYCEKQILEPFRAGVCILECQSTAENIAIEIYEICKEELEIHGSLKRHVRMNKVVVYETPKCWAEYTGKKDKS